MAGIGGELNGPSSSEHSLGHGLGRYPNRTCDGKMGGKILCHLVGSQSNNHSIHQEYNSKKD